MLYIYFRDVIPRTLSTDGSVDHDDGSAESRFCDRQPLDQQPLPPRNSHPPPSGFRIPLASNSEFPPPHQYGPPACVDANGVSPVFVGSAIFEDSVHPCKIAPSVHTPCRVSRDGHELNHYGRYDLSDDFGDEVGPHEGRRDPAWAAAG
jgi:hypothetical protein